jgi:hypothetical protein
MDTRVSHNCIHEEIKSRLYYRSTCNLTVQYIPLSRILSKYMLIEVYTTIILPYYVQV